MPRSRRKLPPVQWYVPPLPQSGYQWLYVHHVLQAEQGADFDFLRGSRGHAVPRDSH